MDHTRTTDGGTIAYYPRLHLRRDPRGWISIALTTHPDSARLASALSVERVEHLGMRAVVRMVSKEGGKNG